MAGKRKANINGKFENRVREKIADVLDIPIINYSKINKSTPKDNIIINNNPTKSRWSAMLKNGHRGDGLVLYGNKKYWIESKFQDVGGSVYQKYDFIIEQLKLLTDEVGLVVFGGKETKHHVDIFKQVLNAEGIAAHVLYGEKEVENFFKNIIE